MRGNVHVRFGRRLGETDRSRDRHRAPGRPNSQIQALDRTAPILPLLPGVPECATHDYKRHGTSSLYAALDLTTGKVIGRLHSRHRAIEFKKFLATLEREVPEDLAVHLVLDNSSTHKTPEIKRWLLAHPRFVLHFTPTSSSWLNLVERWFAELTNKKLRRSAHTPSASSTTTSAAGSTPGTTIPAPTSGPRPPTRSSNPSAPTADELPTQDTLGLLGQELADALGGLARSLNVGGDLAELLTGPDDLLTGLRQATRDGVQIRHPR